MIAHGFGRVFRNIDYASIRRDEAAPFVNRGRNPNQPKHFCSRCYDGATIRRNYAYDGKKWLD